MTLAFLSAFSISLTLAALSLVLGPGDAEAKIKCGAILGPGGTYVLTKDLVCAAPVNNDDALGALYVKGGATLDLNGHTVACRNRGLGIRVDGATLTNGTVRGCGTAVVVGNGIVRRMTVIDNIHGVETSGKRSTGNNLVEGNIATGGDIGFFVEEADNNTFIDNQAINNGFAGFYLDASGGHVLSGNVATGNGFGFLVSTEASLIGNRALENVNAGFKTSGRGIQVVKNISKRNGGPGFQFEGFGGDLHAGVNHNVAKANRGDGFSISLNQCLYCRVDVTSNSAIGNAGIGLHLVFDNESPGSTFIRWNTATGNSGGDLADNTDCSSTWTENTFGTARQACIH